jgi:dUTP pyrophosphatase
LARSILARNFGIQVDRGIIDPDYAGEIGILLYNTSTTPVFIQKGEGIGQIIYEVYATPEITEIQQLQPTQRSSGGYGSIGGFHYSMTPLYMHGP